MPDIFPEKEKEKLVLARMSKLGIKEKDIIEKFVRSQGPGGQNVNKTSTCVYLKHVPTGIEVKCQMERSQWLNRHTARLILLDKIESQSLQESQRQRQLKERSRRQKRRRPAALKLRILESKRRHSEKKRMRRLTRSVDKLL